MAVLTEVNTITDIKTLEKGSMENQIFKKDDVVYWGQMKGEVVGIDKDASHPVRVFFAEEIVRFTINGETRRTHPPVLSFTPYTLEGFSQERPEPEIPEGTLVYVRNYEVHDWEMQFYSHKGESRYFCYVGQLKDGDMSSWKYCQTENPLIK